MAAAAAKGWEELGIRDPIEEKLFASLHLFVERKSAVVSVYVIKPAERNTKVRCIELKQDGNLHPRYTCVAANVLRPLAIVSEIVVVGKDVSVRDKLLCYDSKGGWKKWREEKEK